MVNPGLGECDEYWVLPQSCHFTLWQIGCDYLFSEAALAAPVLRAGAVSGEHAGPQDVPLVVVSFAVAQHSGSCRRDGDGTAARRRGGAPQLSGTQQAWLQSHRPAIVLRRETAGRPRVAGQGRTGTATDPAARSR